MLLIGWGCDVCCYKKQALQQIFLSPRRWPTALNRRRRGVLLRGGELALFHRHAGLFDNFRPAQIFFVEERRKIARSQGMRNRAEVPELLLHALALHDLADGVSQLIDQLAAQQRAEK